MKGILLVNLGSPASTEVGDVRRYLREFLSDPLVIDLPWLLRTFLLEAIILPRRPVASAAAYRSIWTEEGSPLIVTSLALGRLVATQTGMPVAVGMRYGEPSIARALDELDAAGVDDVLLIPLYPHFAMSSYETVVRRVKEVVAARTKPPRLRILPPFYEDEAYIDALVAVASPLLDTSYDHLLVSYHGVPLRHIRKRDPTGCYCLETDDCCDVPNPAHGMCYRAQCMATTRAFTRCADLDPTKVSVSFQSRLGRDPWLGPNTADEVVRLAAEGTERLLVMCPAFVADCLETLEEIGIRARQSFIDAGGKDLVLVPCLNTHPVWVAALARAAAVFSRQ